MAMAMCRSVSERELNLYTKEIMMKKITLSIAGMSCHGCANTVTAALAGVEGVRRADVSLDKRRARLVLEDAGSVDALITAAQRAGYDASLES